MFFETNCSAKDIYFNKKQFYHELANAFKRTAFLFSKEERHLIQSYLSQLGCQNMDKIFAILREPKANQQGKIGFWIDDLRKYFPKRYSAVRIQEHIIKLLEADLRKRQRGLSR